MSDAPRHRIFLDSGAIIDGCANPWGSAKGLLILLTNRRRFTVILADAVELEVHREVEETLTLPTIQPRAQLATWYDGWRRRIRVERWPMPSPGTVEEHATTVLPALRHVNDLIVVVSAIESRPDWVISSNRRHWNDDLARRTGLRIVSPVEFLDLLRPPLT